MNSGAQLSSHVERRVALTFALTIRRAALTNTLEIDFPKFWELASGLSLTGKPQKMQLQISEITHIEN